MHASLEQLRSYCTLERENGYQNTAIIGGLAKMLDFWEGKARTDGLNEGVIQAVIQRLPPMQRDVILLRDVAEFDASEVCDLLDVTEANQRVLLHRARSRVRAVLEDYLSA